MLTMIIKEQSFRTSFALVITRPRPNRIYATPIGFDLGVDFWVTINLTRRGLKNLGSDPLCKTEHIDRTMYAGLSGLNRIKLIVNGRRRASKIINLIGLNIERKGHVMSHQLKIRIL